MENQSIIITFFAFLFTFSSIFFIAIPYISKQYFNQNWLEASNIDYQDFFLFHQIYGVFAFIFIFIFFCSRSIFCTWFVVVPTHLFFIITSLLSVLPAKKDVYINKIASAWNLPSQKLEFIIFQYQNQCCGWNSFNSSSIDPCPPDYESGCISTIKEYLNPRMDELFLSYLVILICFASSTIVISIDMLRIRDAVPIERTFIGLSTIDAED